MPLRLWVAGGRTLIGSAVRRRVERDPGFELLGPPEGEPDLAEAGPVEEFFRRERPEVVILAGAKSGGISANQRFPADLLRVNLLAAAHVIDAAHHHGVRKLLYLASSCVYPKNAESPYRESALLTGPLESTSRSYSVAKLAGIEMCRAYRRQHGRDFISGIPADAFGPGDRFDPEDSHVIAALIRRMHEAKDKGLPSVEIWGSGNPRREFIFVDDLADACLFVLGTHNGEEPINLGGGADLSIREAAEAIQEVVGFAGELKFDISRPDGMPRKALDSSRLLALGWKPKTPFRTALQITYRWFLENAAQAGATAP